MCGFFVCVTVVVSMVLYVSPLKVVGGMILKTVNHV